MKVAIDINPTTQVVKLTKEHRLMIGAAPSIEITFADWLKATAGILLLLAGEQPPLEGSGVADNGKVKP